MPTSPLTLRDWPTYERPRERLQQYGGAALSTIELLAVILGSGQADEHVLRQAEQLLVGFGGLPGLATATLTELTVVAGIGEAKASRLKASQEYGRRLYAFNPSERVRVASPADAANLLMSEMMYLEQEHLRTILLDTRNNVLKAPTIYIGSLNSTTVRIGELFRAAIRENAAAMIVAHNHPSTDPSPSPEDIRITRQMVQSGQLLGVNVLDHIIIGGQHFVSLKERGLGALWDE
ncbi:MAG: DNA repair protein RadC [Anaerolineae bacterium]|nr:DNA repair protein RadC [Anaerolineae bacterium]